MNDRTEGGPGNTQRRVDRLGAGRWLVKVVRRLPETIQDDGTKLPPEAGLLLRYLTSCSAQLLGAVRRDIDGDRAAAEISVNMAAHILRSEIERLSRANRSRRVPFARWQTSHLRTMEQKQTTPGSDVHKMLRFGPFELSITKRVLRRDGVTLSLGSRAFDILAYLAERPGETIGKRELINHVWPDVTVEESNVRVQVAAIRKALGDSKFGNRYIANVRGRGYAFVESVVCLKDGTEYVNGRTHEVRPY